MRSSHWILVSLVALLLVGCSAGVQQVVVVTPTPVPTNTPAPTPEPCNVQAAAFLEAAQDIFEEWDDAFELANSTPRMSLPAVISELQEIRRNADDLEVPPCAAATKALMIEMMEAAIDG